MCIHKSLTVDCNKNKIECRHREDDEQNINKYKQMRRGGLFERPPVSGMINCNKNGVKDILQLIHNLTYHPGRFYTSMTETEIFHALATSLPHSFESISWTLWFFLLFVFLTTEQYDLYTKNDFLSISCKNALYKET